MVAFNFIALQITDSEDIDIERAQHCVVGYEGIRERHDAQLKREIDRAERAEKMVRENLDQSQYQELDDLRRKKWQFKKSSSVMPYRLPLVNT